PEESSPPSPQRARAAPPSSNPLPTSEAWFQAVSAIPMSGRNKSSAASLLSSTSGSAQYGVKDYSPNAAWYHEPTSPKRSSAKCSRAPESNSSSERASKNGAASA